LFATIAVVKFRLLMGKNEMVEIDHIYVRYDGSWRTACTAEARLIDSRGYAGEYFSHVEFISHAWVAGYEVHYIVQDGGMLCHDCANKAWGLTMDEKGDPRWVVTHCHINYEDDQCFCDHCGRQIKPAYGDEE